MRRKVKRLAGTSEASMHYDVRNGWRNDNHSRDGSIGNEGQMGTNISFFHHPDTATNPVQRFYKKWFGGSKEKYQEWSKNLTREGCYGGEE